MTLQLETKKNNIEHLENLSLEVSIQLSLDGFSFCLVNADTDTIVGINQYVFEKPCNDYKTLLEQVKIIFSEDKLLHHTFETVQIIHSNNLATFVPKPFFEADKASQYLQYTIKTLQNDFVVYDTIETANMVAVYIPFVNINNYLFEKFGTFEYKHIATVLVEQLLFVSKNNTQLQFFVHFQKQDFQIIVLQNNALLFYNSFLFTSKEDVIYYILFTAEQLGLNPEKFALILLGNISKDSEIYHRIFTYVRHVSFFETDRTLHPDLAPIASHQFTTLKKMF